jgi:hypothetical protein
MRGPGDRILRWSARLVDPLVVDRVIAPTVADIQCEHARARRDGRIWHSRLAVCRGYLALLRVLGSVVAQSAGRHATHLMVDDGHAMSRLAAFTVAAVAMLTAALMLPLQTTSGECNRSARTER